MSNGNGNGNGGRKSKRIVGIREIMIPACEYCNQPADWVLLTNNDEAIPACDFHKTQMYGYSV